MAKTHSQKPLRPKAVLEQVRKLGLRTPAEAVAMIRQDRNALSPSLARAAQRLARKQKDRKER